MKRLLRASPALLAILVAACVPASAKVGGAIVAIAMAADEGSSSEIAMLSHGGNGSSQLTSSIPAKGVSTDATEPRSFTVFFDFDSAELQPDQSGAISSIVSAAKKGKQVYLFINGHADRAGPVPYNLNLSRNRAQKVKDALIQRGINRNWVTIKAFGETHPLITTPDGFREPRNRRVEIFLGESSPI